jgi:putative membrane protein
MQLETNLSKAIYVGSLTVVLTCLGSWAVLAHQNAIYRTPPGAPTVEMKDARFAKAAALGGMAEIQLGKLAGDHGSNQVVKAFAERMVVQHGAAADQLKAVAQKDNLALPSGLTSKDQRAIDRLAKLRGGAFDRAYARNMVEDHEKDLADFQREANNGKNDDMKAFAAQIMPMIQEHLNQAREMLKTVAQTGRRQTPSHPSGR